MTRLLALLLGRLPIGWMQLSHNRTRMAAALAGVAFANILVFVQLGILGALNGSTIAPYALFRADIMLSSSDANTLTDGSNIARVRGFEALGVPGVARSTPLYIGNIEWQREDGSTATLQAFGIDPARASVITPPIDESIPVLQLEDTVLIDNATRGLEPGDLEGIDGGTPYRFEANGRTLSAIGTLSMGGGFSADGTLMTSDQTFLRLFGTRSASAANHILIDVEEGVDPAVVVQRLRDALPHTVRVMTLEDAAQADLIYQTTERPTGIIFGFGVVIGILVGIVIVYQILSTDVADHLREYATFKAMGYGQPFFLGIVFEEAIILAILGFLPGLGISALIYVALSGATGLPVELELATSVAVFLGTLLACAISGAIATRRLANADPADLF
ncbi:MAG: ABC transporter permease DevC [Pseudomonadota bacterium]